MHGDHRNPVLSFVEPLLSLSLEELTLDNRKLKQNLPQDKNNWKTIIKTAYRTMLGYSDLAWAFTIVSLPKLWKSKIH